MVNSLRSSSLLLLSLLCFTGSIAQSLRPGFELSEYNDVLRRCVIQADKEFRGNVPKELHYERIYVSPEVGLHNKWDLWLSNDKTTMAINLRGTTNDMDNWLENFYSAMIPATGSLKMDGKTEFPYKFADNPRAYVHAGWTIGICSLLPTIMIKIDSMYNTGVKQLIVEGHSQGGSLAFLLTAYLRHRQLDGTLHPDLVIKTYCSAPPKPGNLYFAYDYNFITRGGWSVSVMNTADWVPEMPFSMQTVKDVNLNPFSFTNSTMSKNLFVKLYTKHMYKSLDRHTMKARARNDKFLGRILYKQVKKYMKGLDQPGYARSCNYAQAGLPIILQPDNEYYKKFPDTGNNIFRNHLFEPYYYLANKQYK
jgi:Lipase (class 3)